MLDVESVSGIAQDFRTLKFVGQAGYLLDRGGKFFSAFGLLTCGGRGLRGGAAGFLARGRDLLGAGNDLSDGIQDRVGCSQKLGRASPQISKFRFNACEPVDDGLVFADFGLRGSSHQLKIAAYGGNLTLDRERHILCAAGVFRRLPGQVANIG